QLVLGLSVTTGLVSLTGGAGARMGFVLLYPISVLSGSVFLSRAQGITLALVATGLFAALLWSIRLQLVPVPGMSDVPFLPYRAIHYMVFVTGVAVLAGGLS